MKLKSLTFLLFITFSPLWVSCGAYEGRLARNYAFYVESDNQAMTTKVVQAMQEFNTRFGSNILTYEPSKEKAESIIHLEKGIKARDDKVGWANYRITRTLRNGETSGNVRLDYDFVKEEVSQSPDQPSVKLQTLLFHELGHVFGLGHTPENAAHARNQVMWESINDEVKDFDGHFYMLKQAYELDSPEEVIYGTYN